MFIVLKKSSIKRTLAISILLIVVGLSLSFPNLSYATQGNLYYLYPFPSNNPAQTSLFFSESDPNLGAYTLPMWSQIVPDKQIVIGLPEGYGINQAMFLGDNLSKYITARIGNRLKNGKTPEPSQNQSPPPSKSSITYEREITPEGIKEKVRVEIGEHFKDNDNFEKYIEALKKNMTNKNELPDRKPVIPEIPEIPTPSEEDTANAVMLFGNTITLAGLALALKCLIPLLI